MENMFDDLTKEREGFVMRNEEKDVEIKCTAEYVEQWKQRGFVVVRKEMIRLIEEKEEN